jgi:glyoxylase-like metal-dependent hydrolase (beta-lactamase superfamily II)
MTGPTTLPGLHIIPLPTPFAVGDVNAYLAEGNPLTLIDCGVGTEKAYQALTVGLAKRDYRMADIRRLVITHHHTDHLGLAQRVVEESGAEVWCHPITRPWLERPLEVRRAFRIFSGQLFREAGVPQSVVETMHRVEAYLKSLTGTVHVTRTLSEGDWLELSGCRWQVYHTPGHSADLICMYQPDTRVLLSSDHLLKHISSNPLIEAPARPGESRPAPLLDYLREMARIAELDILIAYPGHGEAITEIPALVEARLRFHQQRADKLLAMFEGQPRTLYELSQMMFPTVQDTEKFLTLSEVLGHVDMLALDGRLRHEERGEVVYWRPTK